METSATIKELAAALCKAQAQLKRAIKDANNPFYKSNYADLESVWEACKDALTNNGLSVVQGGAVSQDGKVSLETMLIHSSGEWVKSTFPLNPAKNDPQGYGSAISYFRRYALAAICGVVQSDDDGEGGKPDKKTTPVVANKGTISEAQLKRLYTIASKNKVTKEQAKEFLFTKYGIESSKDITVDIYDEIINAVSNGLKNENFNR